jgi:hypothetical protein
MTSHELAKKLLELPDLPIATHADNNTYMSLEDKRFGIENCNIGLLESYLGQHIVIGNFYHADINKPNWYVSKMFYGHLDKLK